MALEPVVPAEAVVWVAALVKLARLDVAAAWIDIGESWEEGWKTKMICARKSEEQTPLLITYLNPTQTD